MKKKVLKIGIILNMAELYGRNIPELPNEFVMFWRNVLEQALKGHAELFFSDAIQNTSEFNKQVKLCEDTACDLLLILPMAYMPSATAKKALTTTKLPIIIVSASQDATLSHDMTNKQLLTNQAMHGCMDITNMLWRSGKEYGFVSGHFTDKTFITKLRRCISIASAARVLRKGRIGRLGKPFEGMLDFTYQTDNLSNSLGFQVIGVEPNDFLEHVQKIEKKSVDDCISWAKKECIINEDLTDAELVTSIKYSLALENIVAQEFFDALGMNFMSLVEAGAQTLPFLGASRLLSKGIGYAGEGDVLTAALVTAVSEIESRSTFTELFCPDYEKNEILLSHMGECNIALANKNTPLRLMPREFSWGKCERPAVAVFQMAPGPVTLVCITETPGAKSFKLISLNGEIVEVPEHTNLRNPYSKMKLSMNLKEFLRRYSKSGGTHHLALSYGNIKEEISILADLCQINYESI